MKEQLTRDGHAGGWLVGCHLVVQGLAAEPVEGLDAVAAARAVRDDQVVGRTECLTSWSVEIEFVINFSFFNEVSRKNV